MKKGSMKKGSIVVCVEEHPEQLIHPDLKEIVLPELNQQYVVRDIIPGDSFGDPLVFLEEIVNVITCPSCGKKHDIPFPVEWFNTLQTLAEVEFPIQGLLKGIKVTRAY